MPRVLISLASNDCQEHNLGEARRALAEVLSSPVYTAAIWTKPEGTAAAQPNAPLYLNQLVSADTACTDSQLIRKLKDIEQRLGRDDEARRQHRVPVDLDLLRYGEQRHHLPDWQRAYLRRLLALIGEDEASGLCPLPTSEGRSKG